MPTDLSRGPLAGRIPTREILPVDVMIFEPPSAEDDAGFDLCGKCGTCGQCGQCSKNSGGTRLPAERLAQIRQRIAENPGILSDLRHRWGTRQDQPSHTDHVPI